MKKLIFIGGAMGVGKSATGKKLSEMLDKSVFLDGDNCWDMHPFTVNDATKQMVVRNIVFMLKSFLECPEIENVVFVWVMHRNEIIKSLLDGLGDGLGDIKKCAAGFDFFDFSLVCSEKTLLSRLQKDIDAGTRNEEVIARALAYRKYYNDIDGIKINNDENDAAQTAAVISRCIEKRSKRPGKTVAALCRNHEDSIIYAALAGYMGTVTANDDETSALITVGDFCLLVGKPDDSIISKVNACIIAPDSDLWNEGIERVWGDKVKAAKRYSIRRDTCFDRERLKGFVSQIPEGYILRKIDKELYPQIYSDEFSRDFVSLFDGMEDYAARGVGFVILKDGKVISGTSSYTVFPGGLEIQIDTREEYRRRGLATICASAFILYCLDNGIYPAWDAHDLRSVAVSEKLGYKMKSEYNIYTLNDENRKKN